VKDKIKIEEKPYTSTEWYGGVYTDSAEVQWEFTISITRDYDNHFTVEDINWLDDAPGVDIESTLVIEREIKDEFYARQ